MGKSIGSSLVLQLIILCTWNSGYAQLKGVIVGDYVRIIVPSISDQLIQGEVIALSPYQIQILPEDGKVDKINIPIDTIQQLEVRYFRSKKQEAAKIGAAILGAALGIYAIKRDIDSWYECEDRIVCNQDDTGTIILRITGIIVLGTITGGLVGYGIGSQIRVAKWMDVPLQLTMDPLSTKYFDRIKTVGLTLRYRF